MRFKLNSFLIKREKPTIILLMKKNYLKKLKTAFCILAGNAMLAFLVAAFIIPHGIIMGGTTGIALVLSRFIPLDTAVFVLIQNSLLLVAGLIVLGKRFFITSVASSVLYPIMLALMQRIPNIDKLTDDSLLSALFAGAMMGFSIGLVIRVGSSTGGSDITNLMLNKWFHIPLSTLVWINDAVVVGFQAAFSGAEKILLGIVVLVLESIVLDRVTLLGKAQTELFIISDRFEEIRKKLIKEFDCGVTMSYIETGNLKKRQMAVICVIPPRRVFNATELIYSVDSSAFITVTKIKEVRGGGFTTERKRIVQNGGNN